MCKLTDRTYIVTGAGGDGIGEGHVARSDPPAADWS